MDSTDFSKLPRILYVADLPIEATSGGQLLMYRLLKDYPADKLAIIQSRQYGYSKHPEKELPGVDISSIAVPYIRGTRFKVIQTLNKWLYYYYTKYIIRRKAEKKIQQFKPDILLTVVYGYYWTIIKRVSEEKNIPYGVVIHDDWTIAISIQSIKNKIVDKFYSTFKTAAYCFCVSQNMIDYYEKITGKRGVLLPPPGQRIKIDPPHKEGITSMMSMGYGGSLHGDYVYNFINTCHALERIGGRMIAYTNVSLEYLRSKGLQTENVEINSFIPASELLKKLLDTDVLYLPMDFSADRKLNMYIAFPSKVPDYLALCKPLFIHAPEYASIVSWARSLKSSIGVIATTNNVDDIEEKLKYLSQSTVYNAAVDNVVALRNDEFDPGKIQNNFYGDLASMRKVK